MKEGPLYRQRTVEAHHAGGVHGPVIFLMPLRGVSASDAPGKPFYSPEASAACRASLKRHLGSNVKLGELDAHINDEIFAAEIVEQLLGIWVTPRLS